MLYGTYQVTNHCYTVRGHNIRIFACPFRSRWFFKAQRNSHFIAML